MPRRSLPLSLILGNNPPPAALLSVISKLDGQAVGDAAESGRLDFPIRHWVVKEADAVVVGAFHSKSYWAKVIDSNLGNVVGVQVDHLLKIEAKVIGIEQLFP